MTKRDQLCKTTETEKVRNLGRELYSISLCQKEGTDNFIDEEILTGELVSRLNEGQLLKKDKG